VQEKRGVGDDEKDKRIRGQGDKKKKE